MDTKLCPKCQITKPVSDFHKAHGKPVRYCAECQNALTRQHYKNNKQYYRDRNKTRRQERREWMLEFLKDRKCEICGESRVMCLDFDHKDPTMKTFNVAQGLVRDGYGIEKITEEISKCRILCANCHRVETAKQFGWYKQP